MWETRPPSTSAASALGHSPILRCENT
uniref:Uncharacterized protein n=1 Tax=Macrostomum lignano TaxID=282301 RepID=A0A1I8HAA9_9PLAT